MKEVIASPCSKNEDEVSVHDDSDDLALEDSTSMERTDVEDFVVHDFVIFNFATKTSEFIYVGRIEDIDTLTFKINCMRRFKETWKFMFPEKKETKEIEKSNVILKLPQPYSAGGTARTVAIKCFDFDFDIFKKKIM